eukprot:429797-Lingulodinium_polyedra.AAC.1
MLFQWPLAVGPWVHRRIAKVVAAGAGAPARAACGRAADPCPAAGAFGHQPEGPEVRRPGP